MGMYLTVDSLIEINNFLTKYICFMMEIEEHVGHFLLMMRQKSLNESLLQ